MNDKYKEEELARKLLETDSMLKYIDDLLHKLHLNRNFLDLEIDVNDKIRDALVNTKRDLIDQIQLKNEK